MEVIKPFMKTKENGAEKDIQDDKCLAEDLQNYPCLYEKGNKIHKEKDQEENAWRTVEQFLIVFL